MPHRLIALLGLASSPLMGQSVQDWAQLLNLRPSPTVQNLVMTREAQGGGGIWQVQKIDNATGPLHGDCVGFTITKLPKVGGREVAGPDLVQWLRIHMNDYLDPAVAQIAVEGFEDQWRWESRNPMGAVLLYKWKGSAARQTAQVVTESSNTHWIFTTVRPTGTGGAAWPVTGNRWFAVSPHEKNLNFYSRGAYRLTAPAADEAAAQAIITAEQKLWSDFMNKVEGFIKARGGQTAPMTSIAMGQVRQDWDPMKGNIYQPLVKWVDPEGAWVTDDPKARFKLVVKPGMVECEFIERGLNGAELIRTLPLQPSGADGWRIERPNTDKETLAFAGFSEATVKHVLAANPSPSIFKFTRKGNQLKAGWSGLSVSLDGRGKVAAIKDPAMARAREFALNPVSTP